MDARRGAQSSHGRSAGTSAADDRTDARRLALFDHAKHPKRKGIETPDWNLLFENPFLITRYPGLIVLHPPLAPASQRAERVAIRRRPNLATALRGVQRRAGVDARSAGLALARAGIPVELMRRPAFACSREVRRRIDLAVALARGATVLIVDDWLRGLEDRTTRALADTLRQLAAIDTAVFVIGAGLDRFFPRPAAGLGPRVARKLLGAATTDAAVLVW